MARELDVLRLMAAGCSNRQIAEKLVLAEGTVKFYVYAVVEKLQVQSQAQAIAWARAPNLINRGPGYKYATHDETRPGHESRGRLNAHFLCWRKVSVRAA